MKSRHWCVFGRVQGVSFRAHARDRALALGLRGYVRNLGDGSVEVVAWGADVALEQFSRWLRVGPPAAKVDALHELPAVDGGADFDGFAIR